MKVLFAVNNENISEAIVKKYQKNYKEIISYKNVYYFNAIQKEIQKDKSYDRIVISEDLEQFTNTSYEQMDKFIFEKLDSISDEAVNMKGEDIPIILICTERRTKGEEIWVKLFGIGIYNGIMGNDRSVDEVCRLIYKPRSKKEAKAYYQIDSENVSYQAENENDVSEVEIQNILAHFKRLGNDEEKYIESYNSIAEQYNDNQLKVISKFLPLGVRAVLEEKSPKYQQVMAFNKSVSKSLRKNRGEKQGLSEKLLTNSKVHQEVTEPIIVPKSMHSASNARNLTRRSTATTSAAGQVSQAQSQVQIVQPQMQAEQAQRPQTYRRADSAQIPFDEIKPIIPGEEETVTSTEEVAAKPKRGRGRPRKNPVVAEEPAPATPKRGRGRPRKNPLPEQEAEEVVAKPKRGRGRPRKNPLPEEQVAKVAPAQAPEPQTELEPMDSYEEEAVLPGVNYTSEPTTPQESENYGNDYTLPGVSLHEPEPSPRVTDPLIAGRQPLNSTMQQVEQPIAQPVASNQTNNYNYSENVHVDLSSVLQGNKKVVAFVGTSKNGTSFIVNNLAELLSSTGINVAILDTTQNRNSYYIYTKNEEELRKIAVSSISNLAIGVANGIRVNNNLAVYTSLPSETAGIENVQNVLETLVKSHSVVLIDCDFQTPKGYFSAAQELYLVQSMDVLTIQPLTAFLKDLAAQNILDESKIRIVINKHVKIRGVTEKEIIGGMAYYNAPDMAYQTGLFDKSLVKYITIPFEEETYVKYLEGLINCEISLKGYSKAFMQNLKQLGNMVYPVLNSRGSYRPPALGNTANNTGGFSNNINNTLNQMKRNF